ncbi:MAG: hypothetical protein H6744_19570 [Deltaproteobacteria bacterium]|nr:hypothetical protein [Deltaproteobacteria bacterium]
MVRHQDSSAGDLEVSVDGWDARILDYGESTSWRLARGAHRIHVRDRTGSSRTWTKDPKGILVLIQRAATLTLLPPNVAPPQEPGEDAPAPLRKSSEGTVSPQDDSAEAPPER